MISPDTLRAVAAQVERRIGVALAAVPTRHPLLMAAGRSGGDATEIVVAVDVNEESPAMASYSLPRLKTGVTFDVGLIVANPDRVVDAAGGLTKYVVGQYERELRRRIVATESPNYVGLRGALPESVGFREVGEIDEVKFPGWRSQIVSGFTDAHSGLMALDASCRRDWDSPDLTIVDPTTYCEVLARFQTQQRFRTIIGGIPALKFMRGALYSEPESDARTAFAMHSSDFVFHRTPVQVSVTLSPFGLMSVEVTGREQLYPVRRYRSGTLSFEADDVAF